MRFVVVAIAVHVALLLLLRELRRVPAGGAPSATAVAAVGAEITVDVVFDDEAVAAAAVAGLVGVVLARPGRPQPQPEPQPQPQPQP